MGLLFSSEYQAEPRSICEEGNAYVFKAHTLISVAKNYK
jgi:hypothetical protein